MDAEAQVLDEAHEDELLLAAMMRLGAKGGAMAPPSEALPPVPTAFAEPAPEAVPAARRAG